MPRAEGSLRGVTLSLSWLHDETPRVTGKLPTLGAARAGTVASTVWDLAPDGTRALVVTTVESTDAPTAEHHVVFLQNFVDELRRRVPLGK